MKANYHHIISVLVLALILSSCAKSTKGKMANEWKVSSYEVKTTGLYTDGSKYASTQQMDETTMTSESVSTAPDGTVSTTNTSAMINANEFTIEKDGAWKWVQDLSYSSDTGVVRVKIEQSGIWSFIGKNKGDEFKKNERVLFNVLKANYSTVHKNQGTIVNEYYSDNEYLTGSRTMIYTIKESKKDELQMEMESEKNVDQYSELSSSTSKTTMTLREK